MTPPLSRCLPAVENYPFVVGAFFFFKYSVNLNIERTHEIIDDRYNGMAVRITLYERRDFCFFPLIDFISSKEEKQNLDQWNITMDALKICGRERGWDDYDRRTTQMTATRKKKTPSRIYKTWKARRQLDVIGSIWSTTHLLQRVYSPLLHHDD